MLVCAPLCPTSPTPRRCFLTLYVMSITCNLADDFTQRDLKYTIFTGMCRKKPISLFLAYYQIAKYDHRSYPGQFAQDLSSMQECVCTVHLCILIPFLVHKQLPMKLLVAFRGFHWINQLFGLDEIIISCHVIRLRSVTGQWGDLAMRVTKWIPVRVFRLMRLFPLNIGIR